MAVNQSVLEKWYRIVCTDSNSQVASSDWRRVSLAAGKEAFAPTPITHSAFDPGVITLSPASNIQAEINAAPPGAVFYMPNGVYQNFNSANPKAGQTFFGQSEAGTIVRGAPSRRRMIHSTNNNITICQMTVEDFGDPNGTPLSGKWNQGVAAIDPRIGTWKQSANVGKDWRISNVTMRDNNDVGIWFGHRMIIDDCSFFGHDPAAVLAGGWTGGLIYCNYFAPDNGVNGASGDAINNAQIKLTFGNIGPYGSGWDSSVFDDKAGVPEAGAPFIISEPPQTLRVIGNEFDAAEQVNCLWFDLDARDTEVAYNNFNGGSQYGVFYEGCNNGWVHDNTFTNCSGHAFFQGNPIGGYVPLGNPDRYYQNAAMSTGSSDNILVENNEFIDCVNTCIFFLGARGTPGADWWIGGGFPVVYWGWMQNVYTPIGPAETSSVGASTGTFRDNTLSGTSDSVGVVIASNIPASQKNLGSYTFLNNDYGANIGNTLYWDDVAMNEAAWNAAGRS